MSKCVGRFWSLLLGFAASNKQPMRSSPKAPILRTRAQVFWRFFGLWSGIVGVPSLLFYSMGNHSQPILVLLEQLLIYLAPAVLFGSIGAAVMTFFVPPGRTVLAVLVGVVLGFVLPVASFWTAGATLPKDEATMGYFIAGWVFGLAGCTAGFCVGVLRGSQPGL
jgi:hypothetical protein